MKLFLLKIILPKALEGFLGVFLIGECLRLKIDEFEVHIMKKVIIITSFIISLLLLCTTLFYSETCSAKHKRHVTVHQTTPIVAVTSTAKQPETDNKLDVNPRVLDLAFKAYNNALRKGYIKQRVLTIIDYSLPSSVKRMWVVDVTSRKVLYHTLVAHGKHTGGLLAKHFSNSPGSRASSIGTFVTENTYIGSKGYSLRLRGLEPGFNSEAHSRAIVMHGAWYATQKFAVSHGRLGLSWGCPAVSPVLAKPIINDIKNGSMVFAYYPDSKWLSNSKFLEANTLG